MPIFDQGYQHWQGTFSSQPWRWLTITRHGMRAQMQNRWTRLLVLVAWLPALWLAFYLAVWGLIEQKSEMVRPLLQIIGGFSREAQADPLKYRTAVWTLGYHYFFQVELFFVMVLVVLVGPGLISQDLRFNAIPLYFSRPVRRFDYFLGKLGVIGIFLGAVAIVPAVVAWVLGVAFSLDLTVVRDTAGLLLGSITFGLVVALSAGTLMLALSSLTRNSRYVAGMWVGLWMVSNILAGALIALFREPGCAVFSYTSNLDRLGAALLGTAGAFERLGMGRFALAYPWYWSALVLLGLVGISLWIMTRQVKSLDRLK
jgi:ABC-2 type transport system permease protein